MSVSGLLHQILRGVTLARPTGTSVKGAGYPAGFTQRQSLGMISLLQVEEMVIRFLKSLVEEAAYVRLAKKLMIDSGEESQICGCYYCKKLFFKEDIEEWVRRSDKYGKVATCPYCGIDAVIFHSEKARLTKGSLDALHNYMFGMLHEVNMGDNQRTPE